MTKKEKAKAWGTHQGYVAGSGGWIYRKEGEKFVKVCHGWLRLYELCQLTIDRWIVQQQVRG